jgi:hypothetical protein
MSASTFHGPGVHFSNGYKSEGLSQILEFVMERQREFLLPANRGRQGLLQIPTPTPAESAAAGKLVNDVFDRRLIARPAHGGPNSERSLTYVS